MKRTVALVHSHLRPGGVTRVLAGAALALRQTGRWRVGVLCGEKPAESWEDLGIVSGLGYLEDPGDLTPERLARRMQEEAKRLLGAPPDLWHVHNASLGKNVLLPRALAVLAAGGSRLLLQSHDFAEDGRPGNYRRMRGRGPLYPQGPGVHYAAINRRDAGILAGAGVPHRRVHWLPNPVHLPSLPRRVARRPGGRELWLYPTRGIRRKNIGEAVLLAVLDHGRLAVATTRGPDNPLWRPVHGRWEEVAAQLAPDVRLGVADRCAPAALLDGGAADASFEGWLGSAGAILTTSIGEGFGLAFLEPFLLGLPLAGRDLPEITADFAAEGVRLPLLYRRLDVPLEWVGEKALRQRWAELLRHSFHAYGMPLPAPEDAADLGSLLQDGHVDFGNLPEDFQEIVIRRIAADPGSAGRVRMRMAGGEALPWEEWRERVRALCAEDGWVAANGKRIRERFSLEAYAARLTAAYEALLAEPRDTDTVSENTVEQGLLAAFVRRERMHFLRSA